MSYTEEQYQEFAQRMESAYPLMFEHPYGGFSIGPGWWPIIEDLCKNIQGYIDWNNSSRVRLLENNPHNNKIPDEVSQVVVHQIKEKFGGLRFYYEGGDAQVYGMVRMAEAWAARSCEECGNVGKSRSGGWIKTLCDKHHEERQIRYEEQARKDGLEI